MSSIHSGNYLRFPIDVVDANGAAVPLTSATLRWYFSEWAGGEALKTKTEGSGIEVDGTKSNRMWVTIEKGELVFPPGDYHHSASVEIEGALDTVLSEVFTVLAVPVSP